MLMEAGNYNKGGRPKNTALRLLQAKVWAKACKAQEDENNGHAVSQHQMARAVLDYLYDHRPKKGERSSCSQADWQKWLNGKKGADKKSLRLMERIWPGTRKVFDFGPAAKKHRAQPADVDFYVPLWAALRGNKRELLSAWASVPREAWQYWMPWFIEENHTYDYYTENRNEWRAPRRHFNSYTALDTFLFEQIAHSGQADPLVLLAASLTIGRHSKTVGKARWSLRSPKIDEALGNHKIGWDDLMDVISKDDINLSLADPTNEPISTKEIIVDYGIMAGLEESEVFRLMPGEEGGIPSGF